MTEAQKVKHRALCEGMPRGAQRSMVDAVEWMARRICKLEHANDRGPSSEKNARERTDKRNREHYWRQENTKLNRESLL